MQLLLLFQLERVALQGEHTTPNMQLGSPPVHFYEPVPHNVADTKLPHLCTRTSIDSPCSQASSYASTQAASQLTRATSRRNGRRWLASTRPTPLSLDPCKNERLGSNYLIYATE